MAVNLFKDAVKLIRKRVELLAEPEPMHCIIDTTRPEQPHSFNSASSALAGEPNINISAISAARIATLS